MICVPMQTFPVGSARPNVASDLFQIEAEFVIRAFGRGRIGITRYHVGHCDIGPILWAVDDLTVNRR